MTQSHSSSMHRTAAAVVGLALIAVVAVATVRTQPTARAVWAGVYTEKQADRGKAAFIERCAACHGDQLDQGESPLSGVGFTSQWDGLTIADLAKRIRTTMPPNEPGVLTPKQTADVMAYLLRVHQFPAGTAELPSDDASQKLVTLTWTKAAP